MIIHSWSELAVQSEKIPIIHPEKAKSRILKYVKWRIFLTMATPRLMICKISQNLIMSVNKQGVPRDHIPAL